MLAVTGLAQQEVGAPADDVDAVLDEALERVEQTQLARLAVYDGQQDDAEVHLHLRLLIQVVEHDFGLLAALELEHDAHAVAVALIADFGNAFELLFVDQTGGVFDQAGFVDLIGKLGDDDGFAVLAHLFGGGFRAHFDGAAAGLEVIVDAFAAEDDAAGGEIGALHHLDQLRKLDGGVLHQRDAGFDDLAQIVRRDLAGHAHGDAFAAVDQQVGDARRQDFGLVFAFVVIGLEVDGFLVDVFKQRGGNAREARFGVPHGGGRIAIDRAEVALPVDRAGSAWRNPAPCGPRRRKSRRRRAGAAYP